MGEIGVVFYHTPSDNKQPKQLSPPKPSHGVDKRLMMGEGPISLGAVHRLLTHKEYVVKMVDSIIKETDFDPCADQTTEDLGASGLFDLSRVCYVLICYFSICIYIFTNGCLDLRC